MPLPNFILPVNVWHGTGSGSVPVPPGRPADLVTVGNLVNAKYYGIYSWLPCRGICLFPKGTDIRCQLNALHSGENDLLEIPATSGRYYNVQFVDDLGKGFGTEHRFAALFPAGSQPVPLP